MFYNHLSSLSSYVAQPSEQPFDNSELTNAVRIDVLGRRGN
jgi:hypothetical protein